MPVLVIDHRSVDETAAIARARGGRVIERDFEGFVSARQFALAQVHTPWALMIDADEALDERLRAAILDAFENADGYYVSRSTFFCGKPMRMWRGERLLRLFRVGSVQLEARPAEGGTAQLHERWICGGATKTLDGVLLHYSYPDVAAYKRKFSQYTDIEAAGSAGASPAWQPSALVSLARFAYLLLVKGALLDGWQGIYVAFFSAFYSTIVRYKRARS